MLRTRKKGLSELTWDGSGPRVSGLGRFCTVLFLPACHPCCPFFFYLLPDPFLAGAKYTSDQSPPVSSLHPLLLLLLASFCHVLVAPPIKPAGSCFGSAVACSLCRHHNTDTTAARLYWVIGVLVVASCLVTSYRGLGDWGSRCRRLPCHQLSRAWLCSRSHSRSLSDGWLGFRAGAMGGAEKGLGFGVRERRKRWGGPAVRSNRVKGAPLFVLYFLFPLFY